MPRKKTGTFFKILTILGLQLFLSWFVVCTIKSVRFDQDIGGHLKLAADANNLTLAEEQLNIALHGMGERKLCNNLSDNCYTSIVYRTPDEDVGYWRSNIQAAHDDLLRILSQKDVDDLTQSNQLLKIRESLMDSDSNGDKVTIPGGISRYPNNTLFAVWLWAGLILSAVGGIPWIASRL